MTRKIKILINRYAKAIGIDPKWVIKAFEKDDVFHKRQDLTAMRAEIYVRRHLNEGTREELLFKYAKTEKHLEMFPKIFQPVDNN